MQHVSWSAELGQLFAALIGTLLMFEKVLGIHCSLGLAAIDLTIFACGTGNGWWLFHSDDLRDFHKHIYAAVQIGAR
jgi:hypothetical protein